MAVTSIWKIEKRLDHVIKYISNIEKTINLGVNNESYFELHHLKEYKYSNYNTEKQYFVSGINCSEDNSYNDMMLTKESFNKKDSILGFHAFQSFKEGEVTPKIAHEIGVKLAKEMWGDRFEVIVSTHSNTNHIHNHFVINSVSFRDGRRYYDKRSTYAELRNLSDNLCEEYGLSVLKEKTCKSGISYSNYSKKYIKNSNYYTITKRDIDLAIAQAYNYEDFENLLKKMDYELSYRNDKLSVRRKPYKKNIRVARCYGEEYAKDKIIERIKTTESIRIPFIETYGINFQKLCSEYHKHKKSKGIYALYLHYCYLIKKYPVNDNKKVLPVCIRADVLKMEQISNEIKFLSKYELKTDSQFFSFYNIRKQKLNELVDGRSKLWIEYKKCENTYDKNKKIKEINFISNEIKDLRKEIKILDSIKDRQHRLSENLKEYQKEKEEGRDKNI